jgi:diguanylate cyclase (GGDEF)-like protein
VPEKGLIARASQPEVGYFLARVVLTGTLAALYAAGMLSFEEMPASFEGLFLYGVALFALATVALLIARVTSLLSFRTALWAALPFDLASTALLIVAMAPALDPIYTWTFAMAVVYAVTVSRREAWAVSGVIAAVYLAAHWIGHSSMHSGGLFVLLGLKAAAIPILGYFVSEGAHSQRARQSELEAGHEDIEGLNMQLHRRLAELNAVSEITEVIHSSLDFDAIGPMVLEIVQKVIDVPACSLLVLDKEKAETLFSTSTGLGRVPGNVASMPTDFEGRVSFEGGLFSCLTILDHVQMMVVFCAGAEDIEQMRSEDRLMLQAVASELAVAVENSQLYKLTKRLSITDELTGLHNYRYLQQRLEDEFERARRFDRSLSMLMIDADDFKKFNDRHGHVAGDLALAELGQVLKDSVREIDVAARYGGEEFSVVLPETDAAGAFVVAEKIREAVANHGFSDADGHRTQHLTVSIGVATYPAHAEDREALLRQADDALYEAKHRGRDRVRASSPVIAGGSKDYGAAPS